jgi:acetylornithine deacetylase/succinyl-diaminopimelate desuccinylase-like protein
MGNSIMPAGKVMKHLVLAFFAIVLFVLSTAYAQDISGPALEARAWTQARKSFPEFYELLRMPNDAHVAADIEQNMRWCEKAFSRRGFGTRRLSTGGIPLLLAERQSPGAQRTVLIYLQIDGQPVDAAKWDQPSPWTPVLKEQSPSGRWTIIDDTKLQGKDIDPNWRIFARSTSDAKGPAAAFLAALDLVQDMDAKPDYHIKVIMDFEEELGSPRLPEAVRQHREALQADMLIIFDGPRHVSNQPTLSFGARGIAELTLTTYGPRQPMHSGNYGNYAPNPAFGLARLLASLKDENGRVTLPGFYDGVVLTEAEKKILAEVPDKPEEIKRFLGVAAPEEVAPSFQEAMQYPTLNIRGMQSLYVGDQARTLIPDKAVAEIDIRLVPSSDPQKLIGLVRQQVIGQGYHLLDRAPTEEERMKYPRIASITAHVSYGAFQTPFDSETGQWLQKAMRRAFGKDPIRIRITGGSIPISPFVVTLGIPAVSVPTVNADNNQHAENENIRVGNFVDAIRTFAAILTEKLYIRKGV